MYIAVNDSFYVTIDITNVYRCKWLILCYYRLTNVYSCKWLILCYYRLTNVYSCKWLIFMLL